MDGHSPDKIFIVNGVKFAPEEIKGNCEVQKLAKKEISTNQHLSTQNPAK